MSWERCILILCLISSRVKSTAACQASQISNFKEDASTNVAWMFRNRPILDVAKFNLEWEPYEMLEVDTTDVDFGVNIKNGVDGEFIPLTEEPIIRGGKYRYYNIPRVPCLDTHIQLYAKINEEIFYFDSDSFDSVIEASKYEDIITSSFSVPAPTNTRFEQNHDNVAVHWEPSQCATAYHVMFLEINNRFVEKNTTESKVEVTQRELEPCGSYDIGVTASIGDVIFSKEAHVGLLFPVSPSVEAGDKIDPVVTLSANGVAVKWDLYTLSCVNQYEVRLCHDDGYCEEPTEVDVSYSKTYVEFTSPDNLDAYSKYSVFIKPIYEGKNIKEKHIDFYTLCQ